MPCILQVGVSSFF